MNPGAFYVDGAGGGDLDGMLVTDNEASKEGAAFYVVNTTAYWGFSNGVFSNNIK